ncbi:MAG: hypothetical protein CSA72_05920 [Rhodobacterales bacterium]|nr:MAG: hypothetical protein CSA72_05920 [Rhodobacterales bacterium]
MAIIPLLIQLISGAAGGNIIGMVLKQLNGGSALNTILGAVGGVGAGGLLGGAAASTGLDMGSILAMVGGSAVGGGAVGGIGGLLKNMMAK